MARRPRKNWPLRIGVGVVVLLLLVYIVLPLLGHPQSENGRPDWQPDSWELVRQRVTSTLTGIWFFVFGATIGSFLNVVVYRLPMGLTLVSQPSRCPYCLGPILFRHNVPILGWLVLRGRCRVCRLPISVRYPLVELWVAVIFFSLFCLELASGGTSLPVRVPNRYQGVMWNILTPQWDLIRLYCFHCCLLSLMVVCALLRIDKQRVPIRLVVLAGVVGVAVPMLWPDTSFVPWTLTRPDWLSYGQSWQRLETPAVGLIVGGSASLMLRLFHQNPDKRECDVTPPYGVISVLVGLYLGWQAIVPWLFVTSAFQVVMVGLRSTKDLWATSALLAAWLLLCCWRQLSDIAWLPGATSPLSTHAVWLVVAIIAHAVLSLFRRAPISENVSQIEQS